MPTFRHGDLEFDVPDEWWAEAGMATFTPIGCSYRPGAPERDKDLEGLPVLMLAVASIEPVRRRLSHGPFSDGDRPARDRVRDIFSGFVRDAAIPPVWVFRVSGSPRYAHALSHGAHRFYCSVAAGFTHVPAIEVPKPDFGDI